MPAKHSVVLKINLCLVPHFLLHAKKHIGVSIKTREKILTNGVTFNIRVDEQIVPLIAILTIGVTTVPSIRVIIQSTHLSVAIKVVIIVIMKMDQT